MAKKKAVASKAPVKQVEEPIKHQVVYPRWELVERAVFDIKEYLDRNKLSYNEKFVIMDLASKDIENEWNTQLMSQWLSMYLEDEENKRKINITHKPTYYQ